MNTWVIVVGIFTIIGVITTILLIFFNSIDSRIEDKLHDPEFIKKVATEIELPFLVFDENEHVIYDNNAYKLIHSLKVEKKGDNVTSIIISPKSFMSIPPIIENINFHLDFSEAERINQIDWKYNVIEAGGYLALESYKEPFKKFKLTFIK